MKVRLKICTALCRTRTGTAPDWKSKSAEPQSVIGTRRTARCAPAAIRGCAHHSEILFDQLQAVLDRCRTRPARPQRPACRTRADLAGRRSLAHWTLRVRGADRGDAAGPPVPSSEPELESDSAGEEISDLLAQADERERLVRQEYPELRVLHLESAGGKPAQDGRRGSRSGRGSRQTEEKGQEEARQAPDPATQRLNPRGRFDRGRTGSASQAVLPLKSARAKPECVGERSSARSFQDRLKPGLQLGLRRRTRHVTSLACPFDIRLAVAAGLHTGQPPPSWRRSNCRPSCAWAATPPSGPAPCHTFRQSLGFAAQNDGRGPAIRYLRVHHCALDPCGEDLEAVLAKPSYVSRLPARPTPEPRKIVLRLSRSRRIVQIGDSVGDDHGRPADRVGRPDHRPHVARLFDALQGRSPAPCRSRPVSQRAPGAVWPRPRHPVRAGHPPAV